MFVINAGNRFAIQASSLYYITIRIINNNQKPKIMRNALKLTKIGSLIVLFSVTAILFGCSKNGNLVPDSKITILTEGDTCDFKTFTQGGWGTSPHGNNPGSYQFKNFAAAFPNGLTVGCNTSYTLTLTSAQAVCDFLPCGGPAAALKANYTNPTNLKNVLAGQLVALTLSVGFDKWDPAFAGSPLNLGGLTVASGIFKGMTVNVVLAEANKALGGCQTNYSITDLASILAAINENFDNGNTNNGILNCKKIVL